MSIVHGTRMFVSLRLLLGTSTKVLLWFYFIVNFPALQHASQNNTIHFKSGAKCDTTMILIPIPTIRRTAASWTAKTPAKIFRAPANTPPATYFLVALLPKVVGFEVGWADDDGSPVGPTQLNPSSATENSSLYPNLWRYVSQACCTLTTCPGVNWSMQLS